MRNPFFKKNIIIIAMILAMGTLTACGSSVSDNSSQPGQQGKESSAQNPGQASVTDPAIGENHNAIALEPTAFNGVVRIVSPELAGYAADSGWMKDDYILLLLRKLPDTEVSAEENILPDIPLQEEETADSLKENPEPEEVYTEEYSEEYPEEYEYMEAYDQQLRLMLFSLEDSSAPVILEDAGWDDNYLLLDDGQVLAYQYGAGYRIYDQKLQPLYVYEETAGVFQGVTDEGELWFYTEDSRLVLHKDGKIIHEIPAEGTAYGGTYLGEKDGKAMFCLTDSEFNPVNSYVNLSDWTFGTMEESTLQDGYIVGDYISFDTEDTWYIASMENPDDVTAFTKAHANEYVFGIDEEYLISNHLIYHSDEDNYTEEAYAYDLKNGGRCAYISSDMYGKNQSLNFLAYNDKKLLYRVDDVENSSAELYLWDIEGLRADTPAAFYEKQNYDFDRDRVDALIQEIRDDYSVEILYSEEDLGEFVGTYDLIAAENIRDIGKTLLRLRTCLAEYPEGFFEDLKGESYDRLLFYLCGGHQRNWEYTIENVAATGGQNGSSLLLSFDVSSWASMRTVLLHEMMHLMESRIIDATLYDSLTYQTYWEEYLNVPEYPYLYSYIYEDNEENAKGTFGTALEQAAFIDTYSKTFPIEDRARILENQLYVREPDYWNAPLLMRKAKFLTGIIREMFPSVKSSSEEVFWEHQTGIVNLEEEFPDYVSAR